MDEAARAARRRDLDERMAQLAQRTRVENERARAPREERRTLEMRTTIALPADVYWSVAYTTAVDTALAGLTGLQLREVSTACTPGESGTRTSRTVEITAHLPLDVYARLQKDNVRGYSAPVTLLVEAQKHLERRTLTFELCSLPERLADSRIYGEVDIEEALVGAATCVQCTSLHAIFRPPALAALWPGMSAYMERVHGMMQAAAQSYA